VSVSSLWPAEFLRYGGFTGGFERSIWSWGAAKNDYQYNQFRARIAVSDKAQGCGWQCGRGGVNKLQAVHAAGEHARPWPLSQPAITYEPG
ncbi:hypothetical protein RSW31_24675, partial [Escherichia coli]|uniref:hypothetical protein n=1 Tax=Escherichia coli TaxID=562 RepID=UPI0028DE3E98